MRSDISKVTLGAILVFGIVFLYTWEIPWFQNTLNLKSLLLFAVLTGIISGVLLAGYWAKGRKELLEKFQLFLGLIFMSILLSPLLLSMANRQFTFKAPTSESLEILRIETFAGSRFGHLEELKENTDGFRVFLLRKGEVIRLQKKEHPFPGKKKGDHIEVLFYRGLLGFEYVDWNKR